MIERDNQLLQLNGNAWRFQSRIKVSEVMFLMALLTLQRRAECLTDNDSNDQNNQQAYHDGNPQSGSFQRIR